MDEPMPLDRLSELPDELIQAILSHLPMRDVAATMLLSKRWEHLWATVPCLRFHIDEDEDLERSIDFVYEALELWEGDKILNFSINFDKLVGDVLDWWLRFAVEKQVEELYIEATYWGIYLVPHFLYSCSSIKKLSIVGFELGVGDSVRWNQLKSLTIDGTDSLFEHYMNQIILGAPLLEFLDLRIQEVSQTLNIQSTILKTLKIEYYLVDPGAGYESFLRISAPNLESLGISGLWHTRCLIDVPSLTAATLRFDHQNYMSSEPPERLELEDMFKQAVLSISHAEKLTLKKWSLKLLVDQMMKENFVLFSNAKFLKLHVVGANGILSVLEKFPELEILIVEHEVEENKESDLTKLDARNSLALSETTFPCCSSMLHLKTVEISWFVEDASSITPAIKILLQNAHLLDKLVFQPKWYHNWDFQQLLSFNKEVLRMPRSSPTAEVIVMKG